MRKKEREFITGGEGTDTSMGPAENWPHVHMYCVYGIDAWPTVDFDQITYEAEGEPYPILSELDHLRSAIAMFKHEFFFDSALRDDDLHIGSIPAPGVAGCRPWAARKLKSGSIIVAGFVPLAHLEYWSTKSGFFDEDFHFRELRREWIHLLDLHELRDRLIASFENPLMDADKHRKWGVRDN